MYTSRLLGAVCACMSALYAVNPNATQIVTTVDIARRSKNAAFTIRRFIPSLTILASLWGLPINSYAASVLFASASLTDGYIANVYDPYAGYGYPDYQEVVVDTVQGSGIQAIQGTMYSYDGGMMYFSDLGNPLTYSASALADYGILKARSEISMTGPLAELVNYNLNPPYGSESNDLYTRTDVGSTASALFRDQWTITGQTNGTSGTLELRFAIDGTQSGSAGGGLRIWNYYNTYSTSVFGSNLTPTATIAIPFVFGTSLDFGIELITTAYIETPAEGGSLTGTYSLADYFSTAILNGITVKDSVGNVVQFDLSTASNAALFNELTAVPLPGTIWLLGSGLMGLAGIARRKHAA